MSLSPTPAFAEGRRLRIESRPRWFPDLAAVVRARQLIAVLSRRSITVRYRQTVLGTAWLFGGPLVSAALFTFVFGRVAKLPSNGMPYFAFSYAGLLGWNLFSSVLASTASSLTSNEALITKIYFPRLVLPLSTLASTLINTAISFFIMLALVVIYHIGFTFQLLLLPFWLLLATMLALGIGLVLASVSVSYRDINYVTPMFTQLVMYLSPVAYGTDAVPADLRKFYLLNPFTTVVEGCRWSLLGSASLTGWAIAYTIAMAFGLMAVGMAVFARLESSFADVI
ncbi:MAG: lipopolysaccharide transport system permease protein [Acidimicrobiaceae bacterium]